MCQINNNIHRERAYAFSMIVKEAFSFLEQQDYFFNKQALSKCVTIKQIFAFLIHTALGTTNSLEEPENPDKTASCVPEQSQSVHSSKVLSKSSMKQTTSSCASQSSSESTLIEQIQKQQKKIMDLEQKLLKTEQMILITKRMEREAYKNVGEALDIISKKEAKILKLTQDQQVLQKRIKERDELLEYTINLIEKR